jgi:hypothetical protein
MAVKRPWEIEKEWREAAFAVTSVAEACALCRLPATAYHAMPRNTDAPYDDLVPVCGYCRPHAMTRKHLPERVVDGEAFWVRSEAMVNDPLRRRDNPLRPAVDARKQAFLDLRDRVLARDKRTCQYCGLAGNRLDKINNFRPFTDEPNWVCVCPRCAAAAAGLNGVTLREKRMRVVEARGIDPHTSVITPSMAERLRRRRTG